VSIDTTKFRARRRRDSLEPGSDRGPVPPYGQSPPVAPEVRLCANSANFAQPHSRHTRPRAAQGHWGPRAYRLVGVRLRRPARVTGGGVCTLSSSRPAKNNAIRASASKYTCRAVPPSSAPVTREVEGRASTCSFWSLPPSGHVSLANRPETRGAVASGRGKHQHGLRQPRPRRCAR
jgi:hypothetical protein